jgi:integrase/recombinase XerD
MPVSAVHELVRAINHTTPTGLRDRTIIECYLHGLRNSEVCGLTLDNVAYDRRQETLVLRLVGKGAHEAEVVLHPATAEFVAVHILKQFGGAEWRARVSPGPLGVFEAVEKLLREHHGQDLPLFRTQFGAPITRRWSNKMFAKYREKSGLPESFGPHSLRHTCATELLERDVDVRVVQEVLRHRDIRQTQRYTQVTRSRKAHAVTQLPTPAMTDRRDVWKP